MHGASSLPEGFGEALPDAVSPSRTVGPPVRMARVDRETASR